MAMAMRIVARLGAWLVALALMSLFPSPSAAQSFYTGGGTNMMRVFGCAPLATLTLNGTGATQQGDCTNFQTGAITPALPIETWITAQNDKLQRQVDELTARVQALEAALNERPRSGAPASTPGSATK